ncbi:MAG: hypothetical protein KC467_07725 [Marinomonas atlantica]|nr:hypothetical protein [Marinomonas atlantica]
MIIGLIIIAVMLLFVAGYVLFTQKYLYVHHSTLLTSPVNSLQEHTLQLEFWPSWLPWGLYDESASVLVNQRNSHSLNGALIQLKGQHLGTLSCHIEQGSNPDAIRFYVTSDHFYLNPIQVQVELTQTEDQQSLLTVTASSELNFWHRYRQSTELKQLHSDMRLLLIRLKARMPSSHDEAIHFDVQGSRTLQNVDAVTRPFIVSDRPMSMKMEQGFRDLNTALGPDNPPAGPRFALYEAANLSQHYFVGKLGIPIQCFSPCEAQPEKITFKGQYVGLKYQGSYQHLWLAWHVLHTYSRLHGYKHAKQRMSLEVYETSPRQTPDEVNYITILNMPIQ